MILKLFKLPDGNQSIIVHGLVRFRLLGIELNEPFAMGRIEVIEDHAFSRHGAGRTGGVGAAAGQSGDRTFAQHAGRSGPVLNNIQAPSALADFLAANLPIEKDDISEKQRMLDETDVEKRLRIIAARLATQLMSWNCKTRFSRR